MSCELIKTNAEKRWPYHEYYIGKRDKEKRKNGKLVQNFWSGAESLEYYKGPLLRDTMHGLGVYRWRHRGPGGIFVTYEGHFFNNHMHGYGVMSYPDGRVFTGLYHNNVRWGPGVESHAFLRENVGLWHGTQLIRLIWRPVTPSVTPDFTAVPSGKHFLIPFRVMLTSNTITIGEVNSAIEVLKQCGLDPVAATEKWTKLYPIHCTDLESQLCYKEVFERGYYKKKIHTLEEISAVPEPESIEPDPNVTEQESTETFPDSEIFYAWNNNRMVIHMMKHCYKHEKQRSKSGIELTKILNGPRTCYKPAAQHELDCRTLLMASYLGHATNVAQLINECNVNPNIADIQGNSALLYATCGDQADVIHFLVEAGADVNSYNDACCTPLGVALTRLACARIDIPPNAMVQAMLPNELPVCLPEQEKVSDWNIVRDSSFTPSIGLQKNTSKTTNKMGTPAAVNVKKVKSNEWSKKKGEARRSTDTGQNDSDESFSEDNGLYNNVLHEYSIKVNDIFLLPNPVNTPYIFEVDDISKVIDSGGDDDKKLATKSLKKITSKVKDTIKPSKDMMWKSSDKEVTSIDSKERMILESFSRMMLTILQLLTDGADPRLVRFPQPALYIATLCGSADLVHHLVNSGADVNEIYPQALGYTALDIVISSPFTFDNLDMIRTLLECGATTDRKLLYTGHDPNLIGTYGPTLLHAVLAKKTENETEEDIRQQVLELLLRYRCNSLTQFKGSSAIDVALCKSMDIFEIFIRDPRVDLNAIINDSNQSVLVKMFSMTFSKTIPSTERLQTLTNLLLYGADPLIECYNGEQTYQNLFVFAKAELEKILTKPASPSVQKVKGAASNKEVKKKKSEKLKKESKLAQKSVGKVVTGEASDYKQALDLVIECARLLHIRWLQAKLMKDLIETVDKFKHRNWVMILKEIKNKKCTGLWLTAVRCLEIWDILKSTKKRKYNDDKILRHVLCIAHFYFRRAKNILRSTQKYAMTVQDKEAVESDVEYFCKEHKLATMLSPDMVPWKRPYVTPELTVKEVEKFNVCFECAMPFDEHKIVCSSCKMISFCSMDCMQINIERVNCHPCSDYLQKKYFPILLDDSVTQDLS